VGILWCSNFLFCPFLLGKGSSLGLAGLIRRTGFGLDLDLFLFKTKS
jgi:hypothetical protein